MKTEGFCAPRSMSYAGMHAADYLLWHREGLPDRPWLRGYVNPAYLASEQRRVDRAQPWFKQVRSSDDPRPMPEIDLYTILVELDAGWTAKVHEHDRYAMGLSVLYDTDGMSIVGLFHRPPPQPALLRITQSNIQVLRQPNTGRLEYFLFVEDYDQLPAESPYLDLPGRAPDIPRHYREHLSVDAHIQDALMRPLVSAPSVAYRPAGMAISSIAGDMRGRVLQTFLRAMERMVPPEARRTPPPAPLADGAWGRDERPGIRFRYNAIPPRSHDEAYGATFPTHQGLEDALARRLKARGESSLWGTLFTRGVTDRAEFKAQLQGFTTTDAVVPSKLADIVHGELEFEGFWRNTTDAHWGAFVHAHTLHPSLDDVGPTYGRAAGGLRDFFAEALEMTPLQGDALQGLADHISRDAPATLARNVLSEARGRGAATATDSDVRAALRSMQRSFNGFLEQPEVQAAAESIPRRRTNPRIQAIETVLASQPGLNGLAIWEGIDRRNFRDFVDLQEALDWCHRTGLIIMDGQRRYTWLT